MKRRSPGPQWEALKEPSASSSSSDDELNFHKSSSSVTTMKRKGRLSEALAKRVKYGSLDDSKQRVASSRSYERMTSDNALAGSSRPAPDVDSSRKRQKTSGSSNSSATINERRLTDGVIMSIKGKDKESNKGRHDYRSRDSLFSPSSSSLSSSPFHFNRKEHSSHEERLEVKRPTSASAACIEISDDDELILKAPVSSTSGSQAKSSAVGFINGNRPRLSVARKKASWSSFRTAVRKSLPYQPQGTSMEDAIVLDDSDSEQVRYLSKANPKSSEAPPSSSRVDLRKLSLPALQSTSSNSAPATVETDTLAVSPSTKDPSRSALMSSSKSPTVSLTSGRGNNSTVAVNRQPGLILSRQVWKKRSSYHARSSTLVTPPGGRNRHPEISKQVQSSNSIASTSRTQRPSTAGESGPTSKVSVKVPGQANNHYTNSGHNEAISSLAEAITQTQVLNEGLVGTSRWRNNKKQSFGDLGDHPKQALQPDDIAVPEASAYESSTSKSGADALTPDPELNSRYTMPRTSLASGTSTISLEDTVTLSSKSGSRRPPSAASSTSRLSPSPFVLRNNDAPVTQNIDESKMGPSAVHQSTTVSDIHMDEGTAAVPPKAPMPSTRQDLQNEPSSDNDAEPAGNAHHSTDSEAEINADLLAPLTIEDPASEPEPEEAAMTRSLSGFGKPMGGSEQNEDGETKIGRSSPPSSRAPSDDPMNGFLPTEGPEMMSLSYPSNRNLIPEEPSGLFVPRVYGGFEALNWRSYCQILKLSPPKCYFAVDLPHALQDNINSWTETARMDAGLRHVLEAAILENTADDEPDAPPIKIINEIDDESTPPWEFHYSNKMWYGNGVPPPDITKLEGCNCVGRCDPKSQSCACLKRQQQYTPEFAYDARGRLKDFDYPIFECNDMCGCGEECRNRVVQHGRTCAISLSKTQHKGWGVFAGAKKISEGMFLGIYSGELLTDAESDQRGRLYNKFGRTYLFDLDFHHLKQGNEDNWDTKYVVDAYHAGNFTRFLNHSCDPNCKLVPCYINDPDIDKPLLAVFARRDIDPFEEICFSYFGDLDPEDEEEQHTEGEDNGIIDSVYATCHCGTARCIGRLFT